MNVYIGGIQKGEPLLLQFTSMANLHNSSGLDSSTEQPGLPAASKLVYLNERAQNRANGFDEAMRVLTRVLPEVDLNKIQELVFCHCWVGDSYPEIARSTDYDADYIKDVGYRLWRQLSDLLKETVNKQNFRAIFKQRVQQLAPESLSAAQVIPTQPVLVEPVRLPYQDWGEAAELMNFVGRESELAQLNQWVLQDSCRLVSLTGWGGIGKTALAVKFAEQVQNQFQFLLWRSLRNTPSPDVLIENLLQRLTQRPDICAGVSGDDRITLLLEVLRQYRCLLILDEWQAVLKPGKLAGHYAEGYELYGQLLRRLSEGRHQSCLLLTSREKPSASTLLDEKNLPVRSLQIQGLSFQDSCQLLQGLGLGDSQPDLENFWRYYSGNPFYLRVAARTILDLFDGNPQAFLAQKSPIYGAIRNLINQHYQRLSEAEISITRLLAQQAEGLTLQELLRLLSIHPESGIAQEKLLEVLESLERRLLLRIRNGKFVLPKLPRTFILATIESG